MQQVKTITEHVYLYEDFHVVMFSFTNTELSLDIHIYYLISLIKCLKPATFS